MKNFNNRYFCKNIHRYFTDISDISVKSNISVFTDILILGCGLGGVGNLVHELHMSKATCMSRGYDHETV